ncbi:histone-lysine N-methyltransferase TRX1-like isoform X2 [Zingiber officinale]|uniref:histone-lysine N-methyltransferase TRX1-like isoform X2 n=1 Tax=Zingiber officinale TaxID=94328 RepID=UPI001C4AEE9C|nr:histone-lysine N-methyltransferase TRX1-like isoform X2 [Zingiber officinale]
MGKTYSKKHIWPEGYTSFRKFTSFKDPSLVMLYKMEILRNPKIKTRPSFRVTTEDGEQVVIEGWSKCLLSLEAHVFCRLEHMPFDVFFVEKTYY